MVRISRPNYMDIALAEAKLAGEAGEVPVGAVLVDFASGDILAKGGNRAIEDHDPTAHAEMRVLREGGRLLRNYRLDNCDLYVTLEPCPMCAQAISFARIRRLYYAAADPKGGGIDHGPRLYEQKTCHHRPEVYGGINESQAAELLIKFFSARRGS